MTIGKICNREVVIIGKDASLVEAAKLMRRYHVGSLVVVDESSTERRPIGIVTDRDLVIEVLAQDVPLDAVTLEDIMTQDPILAREDDDVWETIERIRDRGVRRIPVVNSKGLLAGIVTTDDLINLLAEAFNDLVKLIQRELQREEKLRAMD